MLSPIVKVSGKRGDSPIYIKSGFAYMLVYHVFVNKINYNLYIKSNCSNGCRI